MASLSSFVQNSSSEIKAYIPALMKSLVTNFNGISFLSQVLLLLVSISLLFAGLEYQEFSLGLILILILFSSNNGHLNIFSKSVRNISAFIQKNVINVNSSNLESFLILIFALILIYCSFHLILPFLFTFGFIMAVLFYFLDLKNSESYFLITVVSFLIFFLVYKSWQPKTLKTIDQLFICCACSFLIILFLAAHNHYFKGLMPFTWNRLDVKAISTNPLTYIFIALVYVGYLHFIPLLPE